MRVTTIMTSKLTNRPASTNTVIRAHRGSGASRIASVSDWNCRTRVRAEELGDKARPPLRGLTPRGRRRQMPILLIPQFAVDIAALEQFFVPADISNGAALHHQNSI